MAAFAGRHTDNDGSATMAMWGDMQRANTAKFRESVRIKEAIYEAEKKIKALEAENISGLNPENKMDILYASTNLSESDLIGKKEFTIENIARAAMGMKTGQQMSGITIGQLNPKFSKAALAIDNLTKLQDGGIKIGLTNLGKLLVSGSKDYSKIDGSIFYLSEVKTKEGIDAIRIQSATAQYGRTPFNLLVNDNSSSIQGLLFLSMLKEN